MPSSPEITIAQLRTFQQVIQAGGYAAAARTSHLTVPSIWQHIQALEKAYDVRLFERVGRQVVPTEAAVRLHQQIDPLLVQLDSTFDTVSSSAGGQTIRLVTGVRMMLEELAEPLSRFRSRHSNRLVIRNGNDYRAEQLLLDDEADLALTLQPDLKETSSRIHYEPAYTVEFLAACKKNHPFAKSKQQGLHELAKHELVVSAEGTHGRDALDQAFHREDLKANIVAETDNSAFTIACVRAGMGVGIVAGRIEGNLARNLAVCSLSKLLGQRKIVLMWRKGRTLTAPMRDLIDEIKRL